MLPWFLINSGGSSKEKESFLKEQQKVLLQEGKVRQQNLKTAIISRKERERQFKAREKERSQRKKVLTEYQKESKRLNELRNRYKELDSWIDFGNPISYKTAVSKSQKFDFSKNDEVTYICNDRVVKWWLDKSVPQKKMRKTQINPKVFPANCLVRGNFMAYDFFLGETLYKFNDQGCPFFQYVSPKK